MRFNLETVGALRNDKYFVTVRIDDREKINLPSNSYNYNMYDSDHFLLSNFKCNVVAILDDLSEGLKLERNYYKLALVNGSNHPYYYYKIGNRVRIGTIDDIPQELKKNGWILTFDFTSCSEKFLPPENSRVLIDPKDIISNKNITAILKEPNSRLKIQNREKFLEVYDFAGNKIGTLNNVVPYFEQGNHLDRKVSLLPLNIAFENSYFTAKKLAHNYVGCVSDENGECRRFYELNPSCFGYEHDNSPHPYPYYYNLENFGNFLEIDMKTQEYIDLEAKIEALEQKIEGLKYTGVQGLPGIKGEAGQKAERGYDGFPGEKGEPGYAGLPGLPGPRGFPGPPGKEGAHGLPGPDGYLGIHGMPGPKGEKGEDANPSAVAARIFSEKKGELERVIFDTPVEFLKGKTLGQYFKEEFAENDILIRAVVKKLIKNMIFIKAIKGEKGEPGLKGDKGLPGLKGELGQKGSVGSKGADGVTPSIDEVVTKFSSPKESHLYNLAATIIKKEQQNTTEFSRTIAHFFGKLVKEEDSLQTLVKGDQGPLGPKGNPGLDGPKGSKGAGGVQGMPGPKGDQGPRGFGGTRGLKGERGDKGDTGAPGTAGLKGDEGVDGLPGMPGIKGDLGLKGDRGEVGAPGMDGLPGLQGFNGMQGEKGAQGLKGDKGGFGIVGAPGQPGLDGLPGEKGNKGDIGPKGLIGDKGDTGEQGLPGPKGNKGDTGTPGTGGLKGDIGPQGIKGEPGINGIKGDIGPKGLDGAMGIKGNMGEKGEIGSKGDKGEPGLRGFNGTQGLPGNKGEPGIDGLKGDIGPKGLDGAPGPQGLAGKDGIGAALTDQFLREMNKTKIEIQSAKNGAEVARNASEKSAKEAQDAESKVTELHTEVMNLTKQAKTFKEEADDFADKAFQSENNFRAFSHKIQDIFCRANPADQICPKPKSIRKREINNPPMTSRPTSFWSKAQNFFHSLLGQDEYKVKNKIQELNQAVKTINAADIATKFEKLLGETASKCGIAKKNLNLDLPKLEKEIVSKFNDGNRNELLKLLCSSAEKACPHCKQTKNFLVKFKDSMERTLASNEQKRGLSSTEVADKEQPRSFMSDVTPPSSLKLLIRRLLR